MTHPQLPTPLSPTIGIVMVDHGSVRQEANAMLEDMVRLYQDMSKAPIVEPAHMELAAPSIEEALGRCVTRGAKTVVVMPYFLFPGRHSAEDIPRIAAEAAAKHPGIRVLVSEALGFDARLAEIVHERVCARLEDKA